MSTQEELETGMSETPFAQQWNDAKRKSSVKRRTTWGDNISLGSAMRRLLVDHQLGLSINFILLLGMAYTLFPALRSTLQAFMLLSYPSRTVPGSYAQGPKDAYFVLGWVVYFSGIRVFMLDYVLTPFAGLCGITKAKTKVRFAEQFYLLLYYIVYWTWGVVTFVQDTPKDVNSVDSLLVSLWKDFPRLVLLPEMKLYYLMQMAFWIQQIVVIHLEERRKDHYQMLTHHFVTVSLMVGSYGYRQVRVGNAILVCMDIVDLVFPFAKMMRYLSFQTVCDVAFGVFVLTWIFARHICYLSICWSIHAHIGNVTMPYGVYSTVTGERISSDGGSNILEHLLQPILRPESKTVSLNGNISSAFLGLLLALQCITLAWLVMIIRVVIRVLKGEGADDSRSDDEDEDEEIEDAEAEEESPHPSAHITSASEVPMVEKPQYIEVEASSEDVNWPIRKGSGSWKKSKGISSGLNLGDHKDILNRIGCLSEEQLAREREKREGTGSPQPRGGNKR